MTRRRRYGQPRHVVAWAGGVQCPKCQQYASLDSKGQMGAHRTGLYPSASSAERIQCAWSGRSPGEARSSRHDTPPDRRRRRPA